MPWLVVSVEVISRMGESKENLARNFSASVVAATTVSSLSLLASFEELQVRTEVNSL